jgi:ribonucleotide reductase alpha subunit
LKLLTKTIGILEAKSGDFILSRNIDKQLDEFNIIKQTMRPVVPKENQLEIKLSDGTNIHTSTIHPTLVNRNDAWLYVDAKELVVGDICQSLSSTPTVIISIENTYIDENFADFSVDVVENYYAGKSFNNMMVVHNSATLYYPIWHLEAEDLLVLKNNKGTEDNRVRQMDYGIQFNKLMYERLIRGGNITLFSPSDVPGLYDAFFSDQERFSELYEQAEKDPTVRKKTVSAAQIFTAFAQERKDTGRLYVQNVDHANTHSPFIEHLHPIRQSNLCVTGNTQLHIEVSGERTLINIDQMADVLVLHDTVLVESYNISTGESQFKKILAFAKTATVTELMTVSCDLITRVQCTPDHKIYTMNRGYIPASDLVTGEILCIPGGTIRVHSVTTDVVVPTAVYDITVEDNENFYANGILVHNCAEIDLPTKPLNDINDGATRQRVRIPKEKYDEFLKYKKEHGNVLMTSKKKNK